MTRVYKEVEVEVDVDISDFSDEELIAAAKYRGIILDIMDNADPMDDVPIVAEARRIVQNHRCGREWQADALELLYEMANKIV